MARLLIQIYPFAYHAVKVAICRGKWSTDFWRFAQKTRWRVLVVPAMVVQPGATISISQPSQRNNGMQRDFAQNATVGEVEGVVAKFANSGEPVLSLIDVTYKLMGKVPFISTNSKKV
jgi:hypothetical protein